MGKILSVSSRLRPVRRREGFLLSELLAALLIISMLLPVSLAAVRTASDSLDFDENVQDEIATAQLRRILSMSYDIQANSAGIVMNYLGRDMMILYGRNHVYLTPGTQIFYSDLDGAWFGQEGSTVYVWIQRQNTIWKIALASTF